VSRRPTPWSPHVLSSAENVEPCVRELPALEVLSVPVAAPEWGERCRGRVHRRGTTDRFEDESRRHERRGVSGSAAGPRVAWFEIEASKLKADKIRRPVLFGEAGRPLVAYEVDGFHPAHGIVLEVEAGRGAAGNADYRDLIRTSLIVNADYLILGMMLEYKTGKMTIRSYEHTREQIDAIYASERLRLPLTVAAVSGHLRLRYTQSPLWTAEDGTQMVHKPSSTPDIKSHKQPT
jgi:hypothetical protein